MCGFVGIFDIQSQAPRRREKILKMSSRIRHRGPDWSGVYSGGRCMLAHERLAIVDPLSGGQPLYSPDRKLVLAVNGEIYNHLAIRARIGNEYEFQTGSDCEVILALYKEKGIDFLVVVKQRPDHVLVADRVEVFCEVEFDDPETVSLVTLVPYPLYGFVN